MSAARAYFLSSSSLAGTNSIRTGMRWTTLVKLPVALSGGSRALVAPVASLMLWTWPLKMRAGERVYLDLRRLARLDIAKLGFLEVRGDINIIALGHGHDGLPRRQRRADIDRLLDDRARRSARRYTCHLPSPAALCKRGFRLTRPAR